MTESHAPTPAFPRRVLTTLDAVILVVGLVLGAGIFRAPQLVAANAGTASAFIGAWVLGGLISLAGALCYAELATAYPDAGGEYYLLSRALGRPAGFLCAWSRLTVLQTGSIVILAFVVGDYAAPLLTSDRSGHASAAVAATTVVLLTAVNVLGIHQGRRTQYVLTSVEVSGLVAVILAGLFAVEQHVGGSSASAAAAPAAAPNFALAMVFVLLTFGGWSEAAYLSAEIRDGRRGISRTMLWGIGILTTLYVLANAAYLRGLGLVRVAESSVVAADIMRAAAGPLGAAVLSLAVIGSALSSANVTIITGARSNYALGRDYARFGYLGAWRARGGTPARALIVQGIIALLLVGVGAVARSGFEAMVAYTAPVYWLTLLLTGASLIVLRIRDPNRARPYRVPLYPVTPLAFCAAAAFMLYSSLAYAGRGALLGVAVLLAGLPALALARPRHAAVAPADPAADDSLQPSS